jgi:hypothetical protein
MNDAAFLICGGVVPVGDPVPGWRPQSSLNALRESLVLKSHA